MTKNDRIRADRVKLHKGDIVYDNGGYRGIVKGFWPTGSVTVWLDWDEIVLDRMPPRELWVDRKR